MFGFSFGPKTVSATDAHERMSKDGCVLVDVRSREEVRQLGVPGALNIPLETLESRASEIAGYETVYVICRSGGRSAMATNLLHSLGITQAENVAGGIIAWQTAKLPLT